ncbi:hypothetical protein QYF36_006565 [Acer negundo]|nr:hypothetical protein QYF36_006565 [Acer negundo]
MNLEQQVERLEKKVEFLSTQQKEIINHITELFNKLSASIDQSSSPSIQPSQVTAIEDTVLIWILISINMSLPWYPRGAFEETVTLCSGAGRDITGPFAFIRML